jgi:hypothetical protein
MRATAAVGLAASDCLAAQLDVGGGSREPNPALFEASLGEDQQTT